MGTLSNITPCARDRSPLERAFIAALGLALDANVNDFEFGKTRSWDSVAHIQLVAAIEDAFGIRVEDDDIVAMTNYAAIRNLLERKYGLVGNSTSRDISSSGAG